MPTRKRRRTTILRKNDRKQVRSGCYAVYFVKMGACLVQIAG